MGDMTKKGVVVGGSVAGLMAAVVLRDAGYSVTVLERIAEVEFLDRGSGLGIRAEVSEFFDVYGQSDVYLKTALGGAFVTVMKQDGSIDGKLPLAQRTKSSSWSSLMDSLHALFNDSSRGSGEILYETKVVDITENKSENNVSVVHETADGLQTIPNVDIVIGADGSNSTVRTLMMGPVPRTQAGYVCIRSRCPGSVLSDDFAALYPDSAMGQVNDGISLTSYLIPSKTSSTGGKPDVLIAYYTHMTPDAIREHFLGVDGHQYSHSLPAGQLRPHLLQPLKDRLRGVLCPQFQKIIDAVPAESVLIQAVSDLRAGQNSFLDGKVLLVGEAQSVTRSHTFRATASSAFQAMLLTPVLQGTSQILDWSKTCLEYTDLLRREAIEVGEILIGANHFEGVSAWIAQNKIMKETDEKCMRIKEEALIRTRER
ncbi:hypothetical protein PFICI_03571 [Pestalotiopsis fici W106-1]|uniref:Uncharacterized protein n=1 Tax=Pestalotiopsis fici (strain W106-1 / CGMCC3.15140) TaxID=1229662 RepID=W3XJW7_PESFW|nr:uncharacterized protein PFICI_03571 [Pestalotiopsis fici W106-1]ETS85546.1 hypothetical protein PFICI_03571 [Pestalotiopsis fici W106-1]